MKNKKLWKVNHSKKMEMKIHDEYVANNHKSIKDKDRFFHYYNDIWFNKMFSLIDFQPKDVLDFCCGTCPLYPQMNQRFKSMNYMGIDISKNMIKYAKDKYGKQPNFNVLQMDAENLRFKNSSFDLVVLKGALHHLPRPVVGLKEAGRILRKNGRLLISDPIGNKVMKTLRSIFYSSNKNFTQSHTSFTHKEIDRIIKLSGLQKENELNFGLIAYILTYSEFFRIFKFIPFPIKKILVSLDELLAKIPLIKCFTFVKLISLKK